MTPQIASPVPESMPWTAFLTPENANPRTAPILHVRADTEVYAEGEAAKSFYKVTAGVVRTCRFLSDGRRQIEAFHIPGDVFGLDGGAERRLSAEAVTDCTLISYRRQGLEKMTASNEGLAHQLFSYAMQCVERAQEHSLLLARSSAAQKVAVFLLEMARRAPHGQTIELAMTRQDIADYLGLTIETVSRTLSQFEREAIIARPTPRRIVLKSQAALCELSS